MSFFIEKPRDKCGNGGHPPAVIEGEAKFDAEDNHHFIAITAPAEATPRGD